MSYSRSHKAGRRSVVALLVAATVLSPLAPGSVAFAAPAADEAQTEAAASAAAKAGGKSVRVLEKTTETTEVRANPDGTFSWTQHLRPVRVKQSGKWVPADPTLVRREDGSVGPRATVVDLSLSGGGRGSLVKVAADGVEAAVDWETDLPTPVLDGASATYPEVLPGVDLKVTADVLGYSQVLVVKTREAAENPKLRKVTFGSRTRGGKREGMEVRNQSGEAVLKGEATAMWDSTERADSGSPRTATMGYEVTDSSITIRPNKWFLAAGTTKYPVFIDPIYFCGSCAKTHHVVVQSDYPGSQNFDRTSPPYNELKAGAFCASTCAINRTYLRMDTSSLVGKAIYDAFLHVDVVYSYSCSSMMPTQLHLSGWVDQATNWYTQPGPLSAPISSGNAVKNPNGCATNSGGMDLYARSVIEYAAINGWTETTFMLRGLTESNNWSWRKFALNPYLSVTYYA
ncbi:hypothetical protein [Actinokineospora sp. HUAS TT18]|uniref:hypothetical protein n=1 Tax=Actinokineospora sp. HUAS TT18 TaxID=3447451 RepID=UPI003F528588